MNTIEEIREAIEQLEEISISCEHTETRQYCYHRVQELQEKLAKLEASELRQLGEQV